MDCESLLTPLAAMNPPLPTGTATLQQEGAIATVTLSHPGRLNAISAAMWQEITRHFDRLAANPGVGCVVVRGAGGNFSAGADITEFPQLRSGVEALHRYHQQIIAPALRAIGDCPHPTLALIEGACIGGGLEIACECDLRIAGASARLGAPIRHLGFPMAPDEMCGLLRVAGRNVTLELLLEGRVLTAGEAAAKGLLTRVVEDDLVVNEALRSAADIARGAALVARINKQTLRRLSPEPVPFTEPELRAFYAAWSDSPEHREGVRAFLEKRPPDFGPAAGPKS